MYRLTYIQISIINRSDFATQIFSWEHLFTWCDTMLKLSFFIIWMEARECIDISICCCANLCSCQIHWTESFQDNWPSWNDCCLCYCDFSEKNSSIRPPIICQKSSNDRCPDMISSKVDFTNEWFQEIELGSKFLLSLFWH